MRTMLVTCALALLGGFAHADDVDTPESRRVAAVRYAQTNDMGSLAKSVDALSSSVPLQNRDALLRVLNDEAIVKRLEEVQLALLVKHYTTQELDAMADYFSSPLGKSATAKTSAYFSDVMASLMTELLPALKQEMAKEPTKK